MLQTRPKGAGAKHGTDTRQGPTCHVADWRSAISPFLYDRRSDRSTRIIILNAYDNYINRSSSCNSFSLRLPAPRGPPFVAQLTWRVPRTTPFGPPIPVLSIPVSLSIVSLFPPNACLARCLSRPGKFKIIHRNMMCLNRL